MAPPKSPIGIHEDYLVEYTYGQDKVNNYFKKIHFKKR